MWNRKFLSIFGSKKGLLFLLSNLLFAVKAEIEIPQCPSSMDLTSVSKCVNVTDDIDIENYCISGNLVYVVGKDGTALCSNTVVNTSSNDNYIITLDGKSLKSTNLSTASTSLVIDPNDISNLAVVFCSKNKTIIDCNQTSAIVKDKQSKYYSISNKKTIPNAELDVSATSCSSNVGKLATINDKVVLCLSDDNSTGFATSTKDYNYYYLDGNTANGSPFSVDDTSNGILIKSYSFYYINDVYFNTTSLYKKYKTNALMNRTKNFSTGAITNKTYSCEGGVCKEYKKIESGSYLLYSADILKASTLYTFENEGDDKITISLLISSGIFALKVDDDCNGGVYGDLFSLLDDTTLTNKPSPELFTNIKLFSCQNGSCFLTTGYIKYTDTEGGTSLAYCSGFCKTISEKVFSCSNIQNSGIIAYDTTDSKFKICIVSGDTSNLKYIPKEITGESKFIIKLSSIGSTSYVVYEINKTGSIIGFSKSVGNYLYDTDDDGNNEIIKCTKNSTGNISCSILKNSKGYYLNLSSEVSNSLIYADDKGITVVTKDNGYFTNMHKDVIICKKSSCESTNIVSPTCISNDGKLVILYKSNTALIKYCYGALDYDLSDTDKYYVLSSVDASSTYPDIVNGKDTIIIKTDEYSVTQVTTSKNGICINTSDHTLQSKGTCTKYYCSSICKTCTNEYNKNEKYDQNEQISSCANYIEDGNQNSGKDNSSDALSIFNGLKLLNLIIVTIITIILI